MAIQVIPQFQNPWEPTANALGQGLQTLIDEHIKDMADKRKRAAGVRGLIAAGVNPQQAEQLIDASPQIQREAVHDLLQTRQGEALGRNVQEQLFGGAQQGQQPTVAPQGVQPVQIGRTGLGALQALQQPGVPQGLGAAPGIGELQAPAQPAQPEQPETQVPQYNLGALTKGLHPENVKFITGEALKAQRGAKRDAVQERIARENNKIQLARTRNQAARADARSDVERRTIDLREQALENKQSNLDRQYEQRTAEITENQRLKRQEQFLSFNKDLINNTTEAHHTNRTQIRNADQLLVALDHPDVLTGAGYAAAEALGYLDYVRNPATALAESSLKSAATGAGGAFNTTKITNLEVGTFKDYLGRMTNPIEALRAQTKVRKLEMMAAEVKFNAMEEAMKDPNLRPQDLRFRMEEIAQPKLKELADQSMQVVYDALGVPNPNQVEDGKTAATPDGKVLVKATVPESTNPQAPPSGPQWFDSAAAAGKAVAKSLASNVVGPALGGIHAIGETAKTLLGAPGYAINKLAEATTGVNPARIKAEKEKEHGYMPNIEKHWEETGVTDRPKNIVQDLTRRFSRNAPLALLGAFGAGGAAIGNALIRTGIGASAAAGAKKLGAPEWAQDLAEFGATLAASKLNPISPKQLIKKGKDLEKSSWKAVDEISSKTDIKNTPDFQKGVDKIIKTAEQSLPIKDGIRAKHVRELRRAAALGTANKKINAEEALNLKRGYYDSAFNSYGTSPLASEYYKDMGKLIDTKLKEGPPVFSIPYTIGNDLTKTFKELPKWVDTYGPALSKYLSPTAIGILLGSGRIPHVGKVAIASAGAITASKVYELYKLYQSPTLRRLGMEIAQRLPFETPDVLAPILKQFNKAVKIEEHKKKRS